MKIILFTFEWINNCNFAYLVKLAEQIQHVFFHNIAEYHTSMSNITGYT